MAGSSSGPGSPIAALTKSQISKVRLVLQKHPNYHIYKCRVNCHTTLHGDRNVVGTREKEGVTGVRDTEAYLLQDQ